MIFSMVWVQTFAQEINQIKNDKTDSITIFKKAVQKRKGKKKPMVVKRERPAEWNNLAFGGRFMDLFLPMPDLGGLTTKTWGSSGVVPRDVNNGIEDPNWSYWGGNTKLLKDGEYHLFVARWPESAEGGHMAWPLSEVVHAVSKSPFGPFKVEGEKIGSGHNPEWFVTKEGKYLIYVINCDYISDNVNGPWKKIEHKYNSRDRLLKKVGHHYLHNNTFTQREDGSFMMVNRHGQVWFSENGESEWGRITQGIIYPPVKGKYEDPVIWRDNVQYHLLVNDWLGRIAWHLRSKNGVKWKVDAGEAYVPGITFHKNGVKEDWHKYERPKVVQDKYGRAFAINLAVLDTLKYEDLANDNHSSKLITVPLVKNRLIKVLNKKAPSKSTKNIEVLIQSEEDFNPLTDIDFFTIRFGAPEKVDFGKGCKLISKKKVGNNLILTFNAEGNGFDNDNFTGKLLGKTSKGELLIAYSRLPWVNYSESILSTLLPTFKKTSEGYKINVEVENFGESISEKAKLKVVVKLKDSEILLVEGKVKPLKPFEKTIVQFETKVNIKQNIAYQVKTIINSKGIDPVRFEAEKVLIKK